MTIKYGVFIGRFSPFHAGHAEIISRSLEKVDHLLILIGSSNRARNTRNPFTFLERAEMIRESFHWQMSQGRLSFIPIEDVPSDDRWEVEVRVQVAAQIEALSKDKAHEVYLCGHNKDASSFYTAKFPEWEQIGFQTDQYLISATDLRERYFGKLPEIVVTYLPSGSIKFLQHFQTTSEFKWLMDYFKARRKRDADWSAAPFPPKDVCADALCVQSGHVLLVTRDKFPGKGLLALPGGHVNEYERIRDAAIRELREETKIADHNGKIPAGRLGSYITAEKKFDDPYRSDFGRVISHTFLFRLPDSKTMWKVTGADDARDAKWYPLADLDPTKFHDDHYHIIQDMLGL